MDYTKRLINIYTLLRHSNLLEKGEVTEDSLAYFQNILNRSLPCNNQELTIFQTLRNTLNPYREDSYRFIIRTKQWHLCLCSNISVLRVVLNVPDDIVISYVKSGDDFSYELSLRQQVPVKALSKVPKILSRNSDKDTSPRNTREYSDNEAFSMSPRTYRRGRGRGRGGYSSDSRRPASAQRKVKKTAADTPRPNSPVSPVGDLSRKQSGKNSAATSANTSPRMSLSPKLVSDLTETLKRMTAIPAQWGDATDDEF